MSAQGLKCSHQAYIFVLAEFRLYTKYCNQGVPIDPINGELSEHDCLSITLKPLNLVNFFHSHPSQKKLA